MNKYWRDINTFNRWWIFFFLSNLISNNVVNKKLTKYNKNNISNSLFLLKEKEKKNYT